MTAGVINYPDLMDSPHVTREEKLVATYFNNGGRGLSPGMYGLIEALVYGSPEIREQIAAAPNDGRGESDPPGYEISVARIAVAVDDYRLDA